MAYYPTLAREITRRGTKKSVIASCLGISNRSLYNKLSGKTHLTWSEAKELSFRFFPDMKMDDLFITEDELKGA